MAGKKKPKAKAKPAQKRKAKATKPAEPAKPGRPTSFKPEFVKLARQFAELGATDREIAHNLEVNEATLKRWKVSNAAFCAALKVGKVPADDRVVQSLYRRATGYSYDAVKIFMPAGAKQPVYAPYVEHVPPSDVACIFWLKNRDKESWRDKLDHEHEVVDIAAVMEAARLRLREKREQLQAEAKARVAEKTK